MNQHEEIRKAFEKWYEDTYQINAFIFRTEIGGGYFSDAVDTRWEVFRAATILERERSKPQPIENEVVEALKWAYGELLENPPQQHECDPICIASDMPDWDLSRLWKLIEQLTLPLPTPPEDPSL